MCAWYVHSMYNTMLYLWYKCCALCDSERVLYIVCVILNMDVDIRCMMYVDNMDMDMMNSWGVRECGGD